MGYVDAHVHVWTQDFERYPLAPGFTPDHMKPATFTPEELLAHCGPSGVDRIVLIQMSFYGFDNSYMLDMIAARPEVFRGVAVIDHTQAEAADVMARLRAQGVRGLRVQPRGADAATWPAGDDYRAILAAAGDLGMAVCPLIDPEWLPAVGRAAEAFRGTTFVVDHLARIGASRPIAQADIDALCDLAKWPNCNVKVSAFYALGAKRPPHDDLMPVIRQVWEAFGADRLMWASDCPYQVQDETYEDGIAPVRDRLAFISADDRAALLARTAERVFFGH